MLAHVLDLVFPPQCLSCHAQVPAHGTLCLACWQKVRFISEPFCQCCGHPFDFALGTDALCGDCLRQRPPYGRARAVFRYDEASRQLVTRLKYADQTQLAAVYGTWLARFGKELVAVSDVIVPVPCITGASSAGASTSRRCSPARWPSSAVLACCPTGLPASAPRSRSRG